MMQPRFDSDVAHPITDVRLYTYREEGGELYAADRFLNVKNSASLSKTLDPSISDQEIKKDEIRHL